MPDVVKGAAPSSVQTQPQTDLSQLSSEQYSTWERTGKLPDKPPTQDSAPADAPKVETPAEGENLQEAQPESGTVHETQEQHGERKPKKSAEDRIGQLVAETKRLERELEEARKPKAEPQPQPKAEAKPEPTAEKFDDEKWWKEHPEATLGEFTRAQAEYMAKQMLAELKAAEERTATEKRQAEEREAVKKSWGERAQKATTKHPDWMEVAGKADIACAANVNDPTKIREGSVIDGFILDSEIGPEVLYHLAKNPEEISKINGMKPYQAVRYLTALEAELSDEGEAPPNPADKPPAPARQHTQAPKPAAKVGGRNAPPEDPVKAAAASGDFAAYERMKNAEDLARARR